MLLAKFDLASPKIDGVKTNKEDLVDEDNLEEGLNTGSPIRNGKSPSGRIKIIVTSVSEKNVSRVERRADWKAVSTGMHNTTAETNRIEKITLETNNF